MNLPSVTILILNWNGRSLLASCLPPLLAQDYEPFEVVVADNGSTDGSIAYLKSEFPTVRIINNHGNLGFSKGMNHAWQQIESDVVVLMNNDVIVDDDWLPSLIQPLTTNPHVGIVGCKLRFPDGTLQHAGAELTYPLAEGRHFFYGEPDTGQADARREVGYVTGAVLGVTRQVWQEIGYLDPLFSPFYYEEVDFCYRARRAGHHILYVPEATAVHDQSSSVGRSGHFYHYTFQMNRLRFVLKHYTMTQFLHDFVPAEAQRLSQVTDVHQRESLRRVYLETLLELPQMLARRGQAEAIEPVQEALTRLRHAIPQLSKPYEQLTEAQRITEPTFESDAPLVGPLVAAFRETWNEVSTKWYVRLIMQQQTAYNHLVTALLQEQNNRQDLQGEGMARMAEMMAQMQYEQTNTLKQVQAQMAQMQAQLDALEKAMKKDG